jgi:nucleotide-binding universal stress UspA family protein
MAELAPILIAYDGSPAARDALARAAALFPGRRAVVATVWEAGLAALAPDPGRLGGPTVPVDLQATAEVDAIMRRRAAGLAEEGAERARAAGLDARAVSTEDDSNVAETLTELAEEHGVEVVVVGSRGHSGLKARLLGSTSESVLHRCRRPVLVVRAAERDDV